jgi:hypothetical protein
MRSFTGRLVALRQTPKALKVKQSLTQGNTTISGADYDAGSSPTTSI